MFMNMRNFYLFRYVSEVKDMRGHNLQAPGKISVKNKTLKFNLEFNFNNFQEKKIEFFLIDCYDILTF